MCCDVSHELAPSPGPLSPWNLLESAAVSLVSAVCCEMAAEWSL